MGLKTGDIVDEVWVVEKALGTGGMGSVYRAHNRHAPRIKAAIKVLGDSLAGIEEAQQRFVREAEILFQLDHPHIVKVRNVRLDGRPPYIEMEFVEGRSLGDWLSSGPLPVGQALLFAEQLASALRYLHRHDVFHRDIKPANLLVRRGAVLKLVDFGLAVEEGRERITRDGSAFGTVAYAPPEWMRPATLQPRAWDLYALGVVLYEMLTGDVAFRSPSLATPRQAAVQVMAEKQAVPFLDPGDDFADSVRDLVRDLTRKDPDERLTDAREALLRLQSVEQELEVDTTTLLANGLEGEELRQAVAARALELARKETPMFGERREGLEELADVPTGAVRDLEQRGLLASKSAPKAASSSRLLAVGASAGLVLISVSVMLLVLGVGFAAWWWVQPPAPPAPRAVSLTLAGISREVEVVAHLDGTPPTRRSGLTLDFDAVPPGLHTVRWAAGPGCTAAPCPDEGCPSWCTTGSEDLEIAPGDDTARVALEVAAPAPRSLDIPLQQAEDVEPVAWLAGVPGRVGEGVARFDAVVPGQHELEVRAGECPPEARGCSDRGDCPIGCVSTVSSVTVPVDGDIDALVVVPAVELPKKPTRPRGPAALVTRAAFGAWLGEHAEWSPAAATGSGKADDSYLRGVDLAVGGSKPITAVPWSAARAYCQGRGGLAALDAEPTTWSEGATGLFQEWRTDGASPAWRRYDGATSNQLSPSEANAFTGFRCTR